MVGKGSSVTTRRLCGSESSYEYLSQCLCTQNMLLLCTLWFLKLCVVCHIRAETQTGIHIVQRSMSSKPPRNYWISQLFSFPSDQGSEQNRFQTEADFRSSKTKLCCTLLEKYLHCNVIATQTLATNERAGYQYLTTLWPPFHRPHNVSSGEKQ